MRAARYISLAVCVIGLAAADAAQAHPPGPPGGPEWHHGPGRVLVPDGWHGGHWRHEWRDGRYGWWWVVGGLWYYYPAPIYPYPSPYAPPGVVTAPAGQYAYYCANPQGYYPAVAQCMMPWQVVTLATPAPMAQSPAPAIPAPVPAPAPSSSGVDKTTGGTVLGAVGGAVAGAQFGQGTGRVAAAALGTLLGAFIGHEVGQSLDRADQLAAQQAAQRAYVAPIGQTITWNTPKTAHSGTITPVREGRDAQNNTCREFKQTVTIDGKKESVTSTACRDAQGKWVMIGN